MKKKLIFPALLLSCLAAGSAIAGGPEIIQEPDYFSGFFVGGTGAFHLTAFNGNSSVEAPDGVITNTVINSPVPIFFTKTILPAGEYLNSGTTGNSFAGYYGAQGGAGKVFDHRWYAGFMGFGEWGSSSKTENTNGQLINSPVSTNAIVNAQYVLSTTVKISNDYGVAFKPGYLVAPRSMVYGKVGVVWADLKITSSFSGTSSTTATDPATGAILNSKGTFGGSSSNEDTKTGLLLGIGFEQFIYRDLMSINVEYNYVNYGHVSTSANITGQGTGNVTPLVGPAISAITNLISPVFTEASSDAKVSTLLGGLNFYFGSHWF